MTVAPLQATATASNTNLLCGDCADLDISLTNANQGSIVDDFDPAEDASMWGNIQGASANTSCGSMMGNAFHFDGTGAERSITSVEIDATASCSTIDFCLFIGNSGSGGAPCENADATEDVELQYSTDGGVTWTLIQLFDDADWDANNNWQCFNIPIPIGAQTVATMFRWIQPNFSSCTGCDNWAIDDISIACTPATFDFAWTPTTALNDPTIQQPQACPTAPTTTYTGTITNPTNGCSASADVTINVALCTCQFTVFTANINQCEAAGTYSISGDYEYILNPGTGSIVITATNGSGSYSTTVAGPFTDLTTFNYNIPGIPSDGTPVTMTIEFTDDVTCVSTLNDTSPVLPSVVGISGGATYCTGQVVNDVLVDVTGTGPWTIDYTLDGVPQTATGAASPVSLGNAAGVYDLVTVTDANCFDAAVGTETITVNPLPVFTLLGTDPTTCFGTEGFITISGLDPTTNFDVDYNDNGVAAGVMNYTSDAAGEIIITGLDVGDYDAFTITNTVTGCTGTSPTLVPLTVTWPDITSVTGVNVSCNGLSDGSITVNGTDVFSYTVNAGPDVLASAPFNLNGLPAGTYTIEVSSDDLCVDSETFTITEPDVLALTSTVIDASCFGECDGRVIITPTGGTAPFNYNWMQGAVGDQTGLVPVICAGTYTVEVTDDQGCMETIVYEVMQPDNVIPIVIVDTAVGCFPHQVDFTNLTQSADIQTTTVDFGDGSVASYSGLEPFEHTYEFPGVYTVTVTLETVFGCIYTEEYTEIIHVNDEPIADFYIVPDAVSMLEGTASVFNQSSADAVNYQWFFDQGTPATSGLTDVQDVQFPVDAPGLYEVTLVSMNIHGCTDTMIHYVNIINDVLLFAPNAFTPDGDEYNQSWKFHIGGIDVYDFNLRVFNRWGEVVWESNDPSVNWDGTYNGEIVPDGTYTWFMRCADVVTDKKYTFQGHVSVIR